MFSTLGLGVDAPSSVFVIAVVLAGFVFRLQVSEDPLYPKAFFADLGVVSIFAAISFALKRSWRLAYYGFFFVLFSSLVLFDTIYFRTHKSVLSAFLIPQLEFLPAVLDAAFSELEATDFLYLLNGALFVVAMVAIKRRGGFAPEGERLRTRIGRAVTFLLVPAVVLGVFAAMFTKVEDSRITKQWNRPYLVEHFGVFSFHISDLAKYARSTRARCPIPEEDWRRVAEFFEKRSASGGKENAYTGILEGQNLISVHGESVESMFLFRQLGGREITPNLNRLASQGIYFDRFYSQQSSGTSSDSEFTLNTSLYPINDGTVFISHFENTFGTIPKKLREKGYTTVAMHGNRGGYWNRAIMNKNLGYEHFYSKKDFEIDEVIGMGLSDKSFFRQAIAKLERISRPFYATLITLTNHTPFKELDKYGEFDVGDYEGGRFGNYLRSLHYADGAIGTLLEELEDRGMLDDTTILFYGDHPANLPKSATAEFLGMEKIDSYDWRRVRTVPLIIWSKRFEEPRVSHAPAGMIDVMPTLGNMFGFENPFALGEDLMGDHDEAVAFPDGSWLDEDAIYSSSAMKFKVYGSEMLEHFSEAVCERVQAGEGVDGTDIPSGCEADSPRRVFKLGEDAEGGADVVDADLGDFAAKRVSRLTDSFSDELEVSAMILEYDLLNPTDSEKHRSIAQLAPGLSSHIH